MNAFRLVEMAPNLFHGETENRREETNQCECEPVERGLGAAPRGRFRRRCVEAVLKNVEIDGAEFDGGEVVNGAINLVKFEIVVPDAAAGDDLFGAHENTLVEFEQLISRH